MLEIIMITIYPDSLGREGEIEIICFKDGKPKAPSGGYS